MFSSNQILKISGNLQDKGALRDALRLVLSLYGDNYKPEAFQITKSGKYLLGWRAKENGWTEFPFETSVEILTQIISEYLEKFSIDYSQDTGDGSHYKGFLIEAAEGWKDHEIIQPFCAIISISPFTCFYAK